jgi:hypothetical protein
MTAAHVVRVKMNRNRVVVEVKSTVIASVIGMFEAGFGAPGTPARCHMNWLKVLVPNGIVVDPVPEREIVPCAIPSSSTCWAIYLKSALGVFDDVLGDVGFSRCGWVNDLHFEVMGELADGFALPNPLDSGRPLVMSHDEDGHGH